MKKDIGSVSEPLEQVLTKARYVLSSSETGWSNEQRLEIEALITDIEQLRDVVSISSRCLLFAALILSPVVIFTITTARLLLLLMLLLLLLLLLTITAITTTVLFC